MESILSYAPAGRGLLQPVQRIPPGQALLHLRPGVDPVKAGELGQLLLRKIGLVGQKSAADLGVLMLSPVNPFHIPHYLSKGLYSF